MKEQITSKDILKCDNCKHFNGKQCNMDCDHGEMFSPSPELIAVLVRKINKLHSLENVLEENNFIDKWVKVINVYNNSGKFGYWIYDYVSDHTLLTITIEKVYRCSRCGHIIEFEKDPPKICPSCKANMGQPWMV